MSPDDDIELAKERAGKSAAQRVDDGMIVGLGTGSTAYYAIQALSNRIDRGFDIQGVPTSYQSHTRAKEANIPIIDPADAQTIHIAIDGADGVLHDTVVKGGGGAHAREKVIASAADQFIVVVDETKIVDKLVQPIPIEVLPFARKNVVDQIQSIGGNPKLREATEKDGPVITDNGNLIYDCDFDHITAPDQLATSISTIPGVIEHGLFVDMVDEVHIGNESTVTVNTY
ncbi:MAG: ribose-5-phosphate isomerase RpiA [Halobacteriaceae archaeon]